MSLHQLARHVQSHGRNQDTMLIHMTPGEVQGLQAIALRHGGSLTINPKTGLPEAGFLMDILPMIAGVALAPFTGGMSAALLAGAAGGLYRGLKTGSVKEGLMGALGSGLGAYGGASLASGLGRMAAKTAAQQAGTTAARSGVTSGLGTLEGQGVRAATLGQNPAVATATGTASELGAMTRGGSGLNPVGNFAKNVPAVAPSPTPMATPVPNIGADYRPTYSEIGQGASQAWQSPGAYMNELGGPMSAATDVGMAAAPLVMGGMEGPEGASAPKGSSQLSPALRTRLPDDYLRTPLYSGDPVDVRYNRGYAGGGFVQGRGDGMSDDIRARMAKGGEVRLANEEFVVPADVVSGIGNGSSSAGAEKLYAMLNRVRDMRHNSVAQPRAINPLVAMPR